MAVYQRDSAGARILAVATEWRSSHGGLSTFNRELCTALARAGQQVACLLPGADVEERADARQRGVTLVEAATEMDADDQMRLRRRPRLGELEPEVIIGHGRVTGPPARVIRDDFFPHARRVHVVHTFAAHIEWFKDAGPGATRIGKAHEREALERELARSADVVAAVGPLLARETAGLLGGAVLELLPGVGPAPKRSPGLPVAVRCLLSGRAEDADLKGIDIAARAFGELSKRSPQEDPLLVVQGAPLQGGDDLAYELATLAGGRSKVHVTPYTHDTNQLAHELARASLALMPSRREGFGLAGLEAIAVGVPVLVSAKSGLGEMLLGLGGVAASCVVDVEDVAERDTASWARAIEAVLDDRRAAFDAATAVRIQVAERCTWLACAHKLLDVLGLPVGEPRATGTRRKQSLPERDTSFFGRRELLAQIDAALGDALRSGVVALVGPSGSGRGALALEATWRRRQLYDLVWCLDGPPERLDDALGGLAAALGTASGAQAALDWLAENGGWLLLIEDPEVAGRLAERVVNPHGQLLMVGEPPEDWRNMACLVEVGPFSLEESMEMLLGRGGDPSVEVVEELARALGGRPLAVTTAAAYLDEGLYSVKQLLERLRSGAPELFRAESGSPAAVVEMLHLAHEELSRLPLAAEALNLAAFLGDDPIPIELLGGGSIVELGAEAAQEGDMPVAEVALGAVKRFALLRRSGDTVQLHPEVADGTRSALGPAAGAWAQQAVQAVLKMMRSGSRAQARALVGHALASTEHAMCHMADVELIGDLLAEITALRMRAAMLLSGVDGPRAGERALAPVAELLATHADEEEVDPSLAVAVGRARAKLALQAADRGRAKELEGQALADARRASVRPPVHAGIACEVLLEVFDGALPTAEDPWYGALAFRALQASEPVLAAGANADTRELDAAAQLRLCVGEHLIARGQHDDLLAVAAPILALSGDLQDGLRRTQAEMAELTATALEALGDVAGAARRRAEWPPGGDAVV